MNDISISYYSANRLPDNTIECSCGNKIFKSIGFAFFNFHISISNSYIKRCIDRPSVIRSLPLRKVLSNDSERTRVSLSSLWPSSVGLDRPSTPSTPLNWLDLSDSVRSSADPWRPNWVHSYCILRRNKFGEFPGIVHLTVDMTEIRNISFSISQEIQIM